MKPHGHKRASTPFQKRSGSSSSHKPGSGSGVCFRCGQKGHSFRDCTKPKPTNPTSSSISYIFALGQGDDSTADDEVRRLEKQLEAAKKKKRIEQLKAEIDKLEETKKNNKFETTVSEEQ